MENVMFIMQLFLQKKELMSTRIIFIEKVFPNLAFSLIIAAMSIKLAVIKTCYDTGRWGLDEA